MVVVVVLMIFALKVVALLSVLCQGGYLRRVFLEKVELLTLPGLLLLVVV
jgi:hypothetical protein